MSVIRLLPQNLINQIAAGEVVDRPFSVVKELIENSLDAKATKITVRITDGGTNYIQIIDNGVGLGKEELKLAWQRHATSKLNDHDLFNIQTLGFRGEALPSIASVSRVRMISRTKTQDDGWSISIQGGALESIEPVPCSVGTTVEVKDLFYATPARLKFLKSFATEERNIQEVLSRFVLSHPQVEFSFQADKKSEKKYPILADDSKARVSQIMGKDFFENSLDFFWQDENYMVHGFAAIPTYNKASAYGQHFFVNQRYVKDKILYTAVRIAYGDSIPHGRYPIVVLFLDMPPKEVDMNAHPAKVEVRFKQQDFVRSLVTRVLKKNISVSSSQPNLNLSQNLQGQFARTNYNLNSSKKTPQVGAQPSYKFTSSKNSSFFPKSSSVIPSLSTSSSNIEQQQEVRSSLGKDILDHPLGYAKAHIFENYILSQAKDKFIIVDQHAAHERIVYEKMKQEVSDAGIKRQALLIPEVIELGSKISVVLEKKDELLNFGLVIEKFGTNGLIVREIPEILGAISMKPFIEDFCDELCSWQDSILLEEKIHQICAKLSCYGSIRSGRRLSVEEMNALLRQMEKTDFSSTCNHGRPTHIILNKKALESLFLRS